MHAVIVAGSAMEGPLDQEILAQSDLLIAADGGAEALLAEGRRPDVLVGDMDSISDEGLEALRKLGTEMVVLPRAKDETDLEMALRLAVERGATRLTVFGALGGPRLDHLVATMLLLTAPWLSEREARLVDPWHEVFLARGDAVIEGRPGDTVSLLPLTPSVEGIVTEGLAYPLRNEALYQRAARGVSNELASGRARIRHGQGDLLVIHYRKDRKPHVHFETGRHPQAGKEVVSHE